jgi:hypothetical protein
MAGLEAARNLISGNHNAGVFMGANFFQGVQADSMRVQGNYIGTDRTGTKDLGRPGQRHNGLDLENASGTTVGGTTAAARNVISGNGETGLYLLADSGTRILGNRIGATVSGTGALVNADEGVFIDNGSSNNEIGDGTSAGSNTIAFNGRDGVAVFSAASGNEVSHNSIFSNVGLGIDLLGTGEDFLTDVPTKNDAGDTDSGANNLQNKPILTSAKTGSLKTTIKGNLESNHDRTFTVEFYANPSNTNEGKKFIGETSVTTTVDGLASFAFTLGAKVPVGQTITATATDTSEFSAPRTVVSS